jgi:hypothetical protein
VWQIIAQIAGPLGFVLSLVVFVLTRIEKRKAVAIQAYCGKPPREPFYFGEVIAPSFLIRLTNLCQQNVVLDIATLRLIGSRRKVIGPDFKWNTYLVDLNPQNLMPGQYLTVGVDLRSFVAEIERLGFSDKVVITVEIADVAGKCFTRKVMYSTKDWDLVEKSPKPSREPRVHWTDLDYPSRSGLQATLESQGYELQWSAETKLTDKIAAGWERVVHNAEGFPYYLSIKDRPYNLVFLKRHKARPS